MTAKNTKPSSNASDKRGVSKASAPSPNGRDQAPSLLAMDLLTMAAECLKVMAHPVRLRIVDILMQEKLPVYEIARLCETSPDQTCEHLRLMKGHGLLTSERQGRTVFYKIANPNLPGLIQCIRKNCGI